MLWSRHHDVNEALNTGCPRDVDTTMLVAVLLVAPLVSYQQA
jgi:hypothetical protein